jgi:hypothetical protein
MQFVGEFDIEIVCYFFELTMSLNCTRKVVLPLPPLARVQGHPGGNSTLAQIGVFFAQIFVFLNDRPIQRTQPGQCDLQYIHGHTGTRAKGPWCSPRPLFPCRCVHFKKSGRGGVISFIGQLHEQWTDTVVALAGGAGHGSSMPLLSPSLSRSSTFVSAPEP